MDKGWGRTVSVIMGPIFHGKLNKANGICLCIGAFHPGACHPQAASHCPTVLDTWALVNALPQAHGLRPDSPQFHPPPPQQALPDQASPGRCSQTSSITGLLAVGTQGLI